MNHETHAIAVMDGTCAFCAFGAKMVHRLAEANVVASVIFYASSSLIRS